MKRAVLIAVATFFVAACEDDSRPGLMAPIASPQFATINVPGDFSSIQAAHDAASTGDTILVAPGTYVGQVTITKAITLASHYLTTGDESFIDNTILDGGGAAFVIEIPSGAEDRPTIEGLTIQNATDGITPRAKFNLLNCRVRDTSDGVDYENGSGGLVQYCTFELNGDDGIDLDNAVDIAIRDNIIRNNGDDGIEIRLPNYSGPMLNIIIKRNEIYGNGEDGIQLIHYDVPTNRFFEIAYNYIHHNVDAGIGMMDGATSIEDFRAADIPERVNIFNNTFANNSHGITGGDNTVVLNNIFVDHPVIAVKNVDLNSALAFNLFFNNGTDNSGSNVDAASSVFADPQLTANFELPAGSPAIDAGTAHYVWQDATVLELSPRAFAGAAPDLGAFETATPGGPSLKVAFIGDQGSGTNALAVLRLIRDEGADLVLHQGDFDYANDPTLWDDHITSVLGDDFPYFASVGNHDVGAFYGAGGYQEKLAQRLARVPDATCSGDLGVNSACRYRGLFFILSGAGTLGSGHEDYIRQQLAADNSTWRICSWHKNQNAMQVEDKGDAVGWGPYEACREAGAMIATAHAHSYQRTKTLVSTELQTVDPDRPDPTSLRVAPGATFVFVAGTGGASFRNQQRCLPTTYPYGCNGEWASIYTSDQGGLHGALFIEFPVNGDGNQAWGYFKNIDGEVIDEFTVTSETGSGSGSGPPGRDVLYVTSTGGGSVGGVSFQDEDILAYDSGSDAWSLYFDGSDVGLDGTNNRDVRAFELLANGDILLSFLGATTLPDVGSVEPSDIVRFSGSTGPNTSGTFSFYLRGADVGLAGEDIDAIGFTPDGRLAVSTAGSYSVPGASGGDEDLIALDPGGASWSMYFDGSDVNLNDSSGEDVAGVWIDDINGDVYLTTMGAFSVPGVSGDASDVIVCKPESLGTTTSCSYVSHWVGSAHGLSNDVIGLHIQGSNAPPPPPPPQDQTLLEVRVAASSDDAEENASGTTVLGSSDLELVFDGSDQTVGLRFNGVAIPPGATISSAHIQFTTDETQSESTSLLFQGEATDNAETFASSSQNISSRARTGSSVSWSPAPWTTLGEAGPDQRTPNIAPIIQEIVNRPGWSSGYSLAIIITGNGHRTADSYNGAPNAAPLLQVEYSVGSNAAPTASFSWAATDLTVDFTDTSGDSDGTLSGWYWEFGDGATSTTRNPSHTYAAAGDYTVTLTVTDDHGATGATTRTVTLGAGASLPASTIYVTSNLGGSVGGLSFNDKDILAYNAESDSWSVFFDGSDVGLDGTNDRDIRAVELLANGDILLTVFLPTTLPDVGAVEPSDIVRFSGSTGPNTSGTFSIYLEGASVGLSGESIDAIAFAPDGRLVVSTTGSFSVPGASGGDEDLIALDAGGSSWSLYFDGSDVGLNDSPDEDVAGVSIDAATGEIYISTRGAFSVPGVSGDGSEVIVCQAESLGSTTSCSYTAYWVGSDHDLTGNDALGIHVGGPSAAN